jgi:hypothetical protein
MKVKLALMQWLQTPQRSYAEGVELFALLAPKELKEKFLNFFKEAPEGISGTDIHITLLIDKLSRINRECTLNPAPYAAVLEKEFKTAGGKKKADAPVITTVDNGAGDGGSGSGTAAGSMPDNIKKLYDRVKEITPLYAKLHSELSAAATDEDRKAIAKQLCDLDDERRKAWAKIDAWNESGSVTFDEPRPEYSDNAMLRGMQLVRSIKRVRDNIGTAKASIAKLEKSEDPKKNEKIAKVNARKAMLETELDELLKEKAEIEASQSQSPSESESES